MTNFSLKEELANFISKIIGNGSYCSYGKVAYIIPQMKIDSKMDVSFPLLPETAKKIIDHAQQAPYGKRNDTLVDTEVRNTWEIDGSKITFGNPQWKKVLEKIIEKVKKDFSLQDVEIGANLYKLLVYEKGGFFLKHKDTEKEEGMFGSLVINLPSDFTGGELEIEWMGESRKIDFSSHLYDIGYAAFYSDCDHEVHTVNSGYRISLVYNLIKIDKEDRIGLTSMPSAIDEMNELLLRLKENTFNKPLLILLDHQYTPTNFSINKLKGNDINKVQSLLQAAQKAGYFVDVGLLNHHIDGTYYEDYGFDFQDDIDIESVTMSEIIDEYIIVENWLQVLFPAMKRLKLDDVEILNNRDYQKLEEAIDSYAEGYMGNYGPTIEYDYHIGAILLMPFKLIGKFIGEASRVVLVGWIEHFIKNNVKDAGFNDLINNFLSAKSKYENWKKNDLDPLVDSITLNLIQRNKVNLIIYLFEHFYGISTKRAISLIELLDDQELGKLISISLENKRKHNLLAILKVYYKLAEDDKGDISKLLFNHSKHIFENTSVIFINSDKYSFDSKKDKKVVSKILRKLLKISDHIEVNHFLEPTFSKNINRDFIHDYLALCLFKYQQNRNALWHLFFQLSIDTLKANTKVKPKKATNWKRDFNYNGKMDVELGILKSFLLDADREKFVYIKAQKYRSQMENFIYEHKLDISCLTIKRGSPHQLHLTKNENSLRIKLIKYEEDVKLVEMLEAIR